MKNLKLLLKQPLPQIPKWIPIVIFLLSILGFADAIFLTVKHYQGIIPPCSIAGCEVVLSSTFSEILGIPVSLFGSIFYFIILISLFIYFDFKNPLIRDYSIKVPVIISVFGLLASIFFISIMLFVLHAICLWCLASDIITILIFIFSFHIVYLNLLKKYE